MFSVAKWEGITPSEKKLMREYSAFGQQQVVLYGGM